MGDHFEAEHPIFIKKFLKNMVKYLKVDWNEEKNQLIKLKDFDKWLEWLMRDSRIVSCPLYYAINNADIEFIETMLPTKLRFSNKMLHRMVEQKLNKSLKLILETEVKTERYDKVQYIFVESCSLKNLEMIKYIVHNNDFSNFELSDLLNQGLWQAAKNGHTEVVRFLLQSSSFKLQLDEHRYNNYNTALHVACQNGHFDVVKLLLDYLSENPQPVHINFHRDMGDTPLMEACRLSVIRIIAKACTITRPRARMRSPLTLVIESKSSIEYLTGWMMVGGKVWSNPEILRERLDSFLPSSLSLWMTVIVSERKTR